VGAVEIVGHHGTTRLAADQIAAKQIEMPYESQYRWLGSGVYFFQNNLQNAVAWAKVVAARQKQKDPTLSGSSVTPAVVEARIDLTACFDLTDPVMLITLRNSYDRYSRTEKPITQRPFTVSEGEILAGYWGEYKEFGKNALDYEMINRACELFFNKCGIKFRSVRGVFVEGQEIYSTSWVFDKSHVAIAVRKPYEAMNVTNVFDVDG
jgi:hypothetical protein